MESRNISDWENALLTKKRRVIEGACRQCCVSFPTDDNGFWLAVHRAIARMDDHPEEQAEAKAWLRKNG